MKVMLTTLFILAYAVLCSKVWHVNTAEGIYKDFSQLSEANNSSDVLAGDTVYVYPGNYEGCTINKKLVIIGPGYFLDQNLQLQYNQNSSYIGAITFDVGSEDSKLTGVVSNCISIVTDGITIKRNLLCGTNDGANVLNISNGRNNIILQNYIVNWVEYWYVHVYYDLPIVIDCSSLNGPTGNQIINNIIIGNPDNRVNAITSNSACMIKNNVIVGNLDVIDSNIENNILYRGDYNGHDTSFARFNLCNSEQFSPNGENGNICNVDMNDVFVYSGSSDGSFQLKSYSPAIGAGLNGVDCGAFGGNNPYVLSGIPSELPTIWYFSTQSAGYTYPFHIKAKTHR